jgi:competence protein ComEC
MFNLSEKLKKVKEKIKPIENDLILVAVIILVAFISFGLGRLSKIRENKTPITVDLSTTLGVKNITENQQAAVAGSQAGEKLYVASKSGTKYHYPWCSGALNIKEENKIWFSSKEQAAAAGYTPASNCKGL